MNDVLKDVFNSGRPSKARALGFERPFAGKTGTTSSYRDAWFIGYSPRILSLVWLGFDDGHSVRLAGGDACVPIWTTNMNRVGGLIPDVDWKRPEDVVDRQIDPQSGMLATPYCPQTKDEIFVAGTEPTSVCPLHAGSGEPSPFWRDNSEPAQTQRPKALIPNPAEPRPRRRSSSRREEEHGHRSKLLRSNFRRAVDYGASTIFRTSSSHIDRSASAAPRFRMCSATSFCTFFFAAGYDISRSAATAGIVVAGDREQIDR